MMKGRPIAIALGLLLAVSAFAANDVIQVPPDGTGKKLDASSLSVGANTVYRQRVNIGDPIDGNRLAHVNASGELAVTCTGCSAASVVSVSHVTSVTHVAGAGGAMAVNQMGLWSLTAHQGGIWTIAHMSSVTHVMGSVQVVNQVGTPATFTGSSLNTNVTNTVPVSGTVTANAGSGSTTVNQGGSWFASAHQAGAWTVTANQGTPTNWAVNQTQVNGVAVSVNAGVPDAGTQRVLLAQRRTYSAGTTLKTATAAGTGPFFTICGTATQTIRVKRFYVSGTVATAAVYGDVVLKKTSTATSGGTATALTRAPHDSNSAAATATVNYYTVLATAGTSVGIVGSQGAIFQVTGTVNTTQPMANLSFLWPGADEVEGITLRGTAQCMEANFGTTTTNAPTLQVSGTWTEE